MDRERKLLFTVVVLAPIVEAMTLGLYYNSQTEIARSHAAVEAAHECQQQLLRAWKRCIRKGSSETASERRSWLARGFGSGILSGVSLSFHKVLPARAG